MEFKIPYLTAMREQAPLMFNQLIRSGKMEAHLQERATEAQQLFELLTKDEPKHANGLLKNAQVEIQTERMVLETLIDFPAPNAGPEPTDEASTQESPTPA